MKQEIINFIYSLDKKIFLGEYINIGVYSLKISPIIIDNKLYNYIKLSYNNNLFLSYIDNNSTTLYNLKINNNFNLCHTIYNDITNIYRRGELTCSNTIK